MTTLADQLQTVVDEAFGSQRTMTGDELLTFLERKLSDQRGRLCIGRIMAVNVERIDGPYVLIRVVMNEDRARLAILAMIAGDGIDVYLPVTHTAP